MESNKPIVIGKKLPVNHYKFVMNELAEIPFKYVETIFEIMRNCENVYGEIPMESGEETDK